MIAKFIKVAVASLFLNFFIPMCIDSSTLRMRAKMKYHDSLSTHFWAHCLSLPK